MRRGLFSSTLARPRPLLFRPVSSRGFFSAFKAFFSPEKSAERYETLKKEINKGYFYDYTEFARTKGKLFSASRQAIPVDSARLVPRITSRAVSGRLLDLTLAAKGRTTLFTLSYNVVAQEHTATFRDAFLAEFGSNDRFQCIDVRVVEKYAYRLLFPLIWLSNLRIPKARRPFVTNYYGSLSDLLPSLGVQNKTFGHVFLLDAQSRIRWMAHGQAEPEELAFMKAIAQALNEQNKSNHMTYRT